MNKKVITILFIMFFTILCSALVHVDAAELETAGPLLCAITKSSVCDSDGCDPVDLESLSLPPFFKVDFKNKLITDVDALGGAKIQRQTQIKAMQRMDDNIILQGVEIRAWSILISERTGKMTLTASDDEEAGVLFGVCTQL